MRISIALCTHNGAAFLEPQLASLAAQRRPPDELVVCDDASTDSTREQLRAFAAEAPFPVRVTENPVALGVTGNFARAIGLCAGDVIFTCDQDDVWHPDKVADLAAAFTANESLGLAFCDLHLVDQSGRPTGATQWQALAFGTEERARFRAGNGCDVLLRRNVVTGTGMAFAARLRDVFLPIPDAFVHDEWIAFIAAALAPVAIIPRPLVHYRQHGGQQIGGAITGLFDQVAHARANMRGPYFDRQIARTQALIDRLSPLRARLLDPAIIDRLDERLLHLGRRVALRASAFRGVPMLLAEWRSGRYRRFAYGWKSALQDLLL